MRLAALALLASLAGAVTPASAADDACWKVGPPSLETYERNSIGWTKDSDDVGFLDVNLSLKYPIAPACLSMVAPDSRMYFAATVRFGQYIGTRDSSPVVGKRFNPKLIWRRALPWGGGGSNNECPGKADKWHCRYVDVAFAHESNGQSVNSQKLFRAAEEQSLSQDGRRDFARDAISRGWDYFEVAARTVVLKDARLDASLKHYLPHGPLQGAAEEYNDWEQDAEGKPRRRVSGLSFLASWFSGPRMSIGLDTGYAQPFRYNTLRIEARGNVFQLPVMLFYRNGYESDLALYYKKGWSTGIALEVARF